MKIAFLISTVHDLGGTAGAVVTQANALCTRHEVEIISVYRDEGHHFPVDPRVTVTDLVDLRGDKVAVPGLDPDRAAALQGRQPTMIEAGSDPTLDALADVALEGALPDLDADVLVTVTPGTLGYATQLAPARTAIVHQEHRSSSQRPNSRRLLLDHARRADVVVMLTEPMARWLAVELGPDAPADRGGAQRAGAGVPAALPADRAGHPRRRPAGHREAVDPPDLRVRHGRRPDPRVAGADLRPPATPGSTSCRCPGSSGSGTGSSAPARPPT